ncbi:MAG: hypothetical protein R3C02_10245 [Planctomycetaceae bacterium]
MPGIRPVILDHGLWTDAMPRHRRRVTRGIFAVVQTLVMVCVWSQPFIIFAADDTTSVTIEQTRWGFDNKCVLRTFVPLSILVRNDSPNEFEGTLRLTRGLRVTEQIDAAIEQDVYVGPLSSRWVQMMPYVMGDWEQWSLSWVGQEDDPSQLPTPNAGERATVLLYDPDQLQTAGGVLNRFPADLFPTSITALDGLRGVVFDKPPRWQGARREAFLDWLRSGGRVYLLQNEQGEYPTFGDSLSVLNRDDETFSIGNGTVRHIPVSASAIDLQTANDLILHDEAGRYNTKSWQKFRKTEGYDGRMPLINQSGWDRDTELLGHLQDLSRFKRNWLAIYGLAVLYVLALFPGCYWLGRRLKRHQWFYVGFLTFVGLFSVGFVSLGRLGAAHTARIRSVAVARQLDEGLFDVTGWSSAAVNQGGDYLIEHAGTGRIYTAGSEIEKVRGRIVGGPEAHLEANIPPASTRSVIHRTRQEGPALGVAVSRIAFDSGQLGQLSIRTGEGFPVKPLSVHAWHQNHVFEMKLNGPEWTITPSNRKQGISFLADVSELQFMRFGLARKGPSWLDPEPPPLTDEYKKLTRSLIGNSFGLNNTVDPLRLALEPNVIRLLIYAEMPAEFHAKGDTFPDQYGCLMYVVDLTTSPAPRALSPDSAPAKE